MIASGHVFDSFIVVFDGVGFGVAIKKSTLDFKSCHLARLANLVLRAYDVKVNNMARFRYRPRAVKPGATR